MCPRRRTAAKCSRLVGVGGEPVLLEGRGEPVLGSIVRARHCRTVDDFRDSNPPSNAPLLDTLAVEFAKNGFSRKWAVKTMMKSRTYQLSSRKNAFNTTDEIYFSHAGTRLLSAETLLDAICQVTSVPEAFPGAPPARGRWSCRNRRRTTTS